MSGDGGALRRSSDLATATLVRRLRVLGSVLYERDLDCDAASEAADRIEAMAVRLTDAERLLHRASEHIGWTDDDLDNEVPAFLAGVSTRDWCALRVRACGRADDHLPHVWHPAEHPDMRCLGAFIAEGDR